MPRSQKSRLKKRPLVPYARGFRPPTPKQRWTAVSARLNEEIPREFQEEAHLFPPIPQPSSVDDWLAQYNEEGQTYSQFLKECLWFSRRKVKYCRMPFNPAGSTLSEKYPNGKIYLLPLGEFLGAAVDAPSFDNLADYATRFFQQEVQILPAVEILVDREKEEVCWVESSTAAEALEGANQTRRSGRTRRHRLEARFHRKSGNYQLQGGPLLAKIQQMMPSDAICLMALTMSDIYNTSPDLFVAGLAAGNHRVGVFSLRRYAPNLTFSTEHWHQITKLDSKTVPSQQEAKRVILQRSCKLLVHEVAHLLGLDHCIWYSCCMNGSGHLDEDFKQSMHLCPIDLRKLQYLCGFDVVKRYERLLEFFRTHGLVEEEEWITKRLIHVTVS